MMPTSSVNSIDESFLAALYMLIRIRIIRFQMIEQVQISIYFRPNLRRNWLRNLQYETCKIIKKLSI